MGVPSIAELDQNTSLVSASAHITTSFAFYPNSLRFFVARLNEKPPPPPFLLEILQSEYESTQQHDNDSTTSIIYTWYGSFAVVEKALGGEKECTAANHGKRTGQI